MEKKILVIDDDPDFVTSTAIVLRSRGYQVLEALSGKEGLELSKKEKPDLYLVDLMMETYGEGIKLADALDKDEYAKDKPRIMITSLSIQGPWGTYSDHQKVSFDLVLQKPVSPETLLKTVEKVLA
ncbi:MAG: response regulator [Pseudomonadota bacterium]